MVVYASVKWHDELQEYLLTHAHHTHTQKTRSPILINHAVLSYFPHKNVRLPRE